MDPWIWAILLLLLGLALIVLEVFVPSGGLLSLLAAGSVLGAIGVAFADGPRLGVIILVVAAVGVPAVVSLAIRWWPSTPLGKRMLIQRPGGNLGPTRRDDEHDRRQALIGKRGWTRSKMLPSGAVVIEGQTYDAVTEGIPIDREQPVRVVAVRANRMVVRRIEEGETPPQQSEEELLSRPLESLGLEPLDDPLQ